MSSQALFGISVAVSFIAWAVVHAAIPLASPAQSIAYQRPATHTPLAQFSVRWLGVPGAGSRLAGFAGSLRASGRVR